MESIIEFEFMVFHELSDSIYLKFTFMYYQSRVHTTDTVVLTSTPFFIGEWTLPDTNTDGDLTAAHMIHWLSYSVLMLINHHIEFYISIAP
jgi:hypothetical protein